VDELFRVIERVRERIRRYGGELRRSEALTRYVLVDPVLRALGWDTEDPEAGLGPQGAQGPPRGGGLHSFRSIYTRLRRARSPAGRQHSQGALEGLQGLRSPERYSYDKGLKRLAS